MKKFFMGSAALCSVLFCSLAHADKGDYYIVPKGGVMKIDYYSAKPLFAVGMYGGYGFNRNIAVEGEVNYGFVGGSYSEGANTGRYRITTGGLYGAYRAPVIENLFFLKAKLGTVLEYVQNISKSTYPNTALSISGGLGFAVQLEKLLTLEAEYTLIETNVTYMSLGAHYKF